MVLFQNPQVQWEAFTLEFIKLCEKKDPDIWQVNSQDERCSGTSTVP